MVNTLYLAPHDIKQGTILERHLQGIWDSTLCIMVIYIIIIIIIMMIYNYLSTL